MRKIFFTTFLIFSAFMLLAQIPQSFKYQTVVRNNEGKALANTMIGLRISILFGTPTGNAVYVETFQHATNEFGIASINIGKGTTTQGVFAAINWAAGEYFIKTEVDITGATNYEYIGTSQLLAVPYALYAEKAGKSLNDADTSATNELQDITKTGNTISLSQGGGSVTDSDNQTINLNGFDLSISGGNTIQLPPDVDHDTLNEIQNLSITNHQLSISKGNTITIPDNQTLSLNGTELSINNGNSVFLQPDNDHDTLNEIQVLTKANDTIYLSKNGGFVKDNDNQTISLNGNQLTISNGNTLALSGSIDLDSDPTNELQTLSYHNDTISISNGNSIVIPNPNTGTQGINTGDLQYWNGSQWIVLPAGSNGQLLTICNGIPTWGGCLPEVLTNSLNVTSDTSINISGSLISNGGLTISSLGFCYNTSQNPTVNDYTIQCNGNNIFSIDINNLTPNTIYYIRSYATNNKGTAYGNELTFTTSLLPIVETSPISLITQNSAQSGGTVIFDGGIANTTRGVCWSTSQYPTLSDNYTNDGIGEGTFNSSINGLTPSTTYYVRAWATNTVGTAYGEQFSFISSNPCPSIINGYEAIEIGSQCWMKENLSNPTYSDGTSIPQVQSSTWSSLTSGAYCTYNGQLLYNWYAVHDIKGLCPAGWHIPNNSEWNVLITFLGGTNVAGGKLKEAGTTHWNTPNTGADNSSGFTAIGAGWRGQDGTFLELMNQGCYWSSTGTLDGLYLLLQYNSAGALINNMNKEAGLSVRCIRD